MKKLKKNISKKQIKRSRLKSKNSRKLIKNSKIDDIDNLLYAILNSKDDFKIILTVSNEFLCAGKLDSLGYDYVKGASRFGIIEDPDFLFDMYSTNSLPFPENLAIEQIERAFDRPSDHDDMIKIFKFYSNDIEMNSEEIEKLSNIINITPLSKIHLHSHQTKIFTKPSKVINIIINLKQNAEVKITEQMNLDKALKLIKKNK